jgi:WD40 repeat protein
MTEDDIRSQIISLLLKREKIKYVDLESILGCNHEIITKVCDDLRFGEMAKDIDGIGIKATEGLRVLSNTHQAPSTTTVPASADNGGVQSQDPCDIIHPSPSVTSSLRKPEKPLKIFLSYGHDQHVKDALRIKADLEVRGHEVWFDLDRLKAGRNWEQYIEEGLKNCDKVVLLMTPYSVRRRNPFDPESTDGYCLNEIAKALEKNRLIIPVLMVELGDGMPTSICRIQFLDLRDVVPIDHNPEKYLTRFERLVEAIEQNRLDFEGGQARLLRYLQPIDFQADIAEHISRFTGRQWLFDEINAGLTEQPESRIFWLLGGPGVGKSAIAAHLCHYRGDVVAYHLCIHGHDDKSDPRRAVLSIAYQIAQHLPEYDTRIQALNIEKEALKNAQTLFDKLLVEPFLRDFPRPASDRLVIIDAIDEATRGHSNEIAQFIRDQWHRAPPWLRLIITSRPEADVKKYLQGLIPYEFQVDRPENIKDLRLFLEKELNSRERHLGATEEQIVRLLDLSQGVFLYLVEVIKEIDEKRLSLDRLDEFPRSLGAMYQRFFERKFPDVDDYQETVRPAIECICSAREALPQELLGKALSLSNVDLQKLLDRTGSFFPRRIIRNERVVVPFHKSIVDWLVEQREDGSFVSGDYAIDPIAGRHRIVKVCLNEAVSNIDQLSGYTLRHLPSELAVLEKWDPLTSLLMDIRFIDKKLSTEGVYAIYSDYDLVLDPSKGQLPELDINLKEALHKVQAAIRLSRHVLGPHPQELQSQLTGRLLGINEWNIRQFLENVRESAKKIWLRPITSSLTSPGGALVQTITNLGKEPVTALAVTSDGLFALCGANNFCGIIVWDLVYGRFIKNFIDDTNDAANTDVTAIAITPDDNLVVSGFSNGTLKVWNRKTGQETVTLDGHTDSITTIIILPEGRRAVSGSKDMTLKVWDLATGREIMTLKGHTNLITSVASTPDGRFLISGSRDNSLILWNLETGDKTTVRIGPDYRIWAVAMTSDGLSAILGSGSTLKVMNLKTGQEAATFTGHTRPITAVVVTPDGQQAISGSKDMTLKVWDLKTGKEKITLEGHSHEITSIAVTPNGKNVISGSADRTMKVWDLAMNSRTVAQDVHSNPITDIAVMLDGHYAISSSGNTMTIWNLMTGRETAVLEGHSDWVRSIAMLPNGEQAISGSDDRTLKVWSLENRSVISTFIGHSDSVRAVAATPDGHHVVSGSVDGTLMIWNVATGHGTPTLTHHGGLVEAVTVTPDGWYAISGSVDHTIKIWDIATGRETATLKGHTDSIRAVVVTPDNRFVISGSADNTLKIWNLKTGQEKLTLRGHTGWVETVAVTSDGRLAISGSTDHSLKIWDLETGTIVVEYTGDAPIRACGYSTHLRTVIAGDKNGRIHILKLENYLEDLSIVTPSREGPGKPLIICCPQCMRWQEIQEMDLGKAFTCSFCKQEFRLNPFFITTKIGLQYLCHEHNRQE